MRLLTLLLLTGMAGAACAGPLRAPADLYAGVCARCHEARVGPPLLGRSLAPAITSTFVRRGMNGMPAFRASEISDQELQALARFIEGAEVTR